MRKNLLALAVMLTGPALFTACLNSDDNNTPNTWHGLVSKGVYVVCGGEASSLTYFKYEGETTEQQYFQKKNGNKKLGSHANDIIAYGTKLYIVVSGDNAVEVVDLKTGTSVRQINLVGLVGEKGVNPRRITADNGVVYVSTYGGSDEEGEVAASGNGYVVAIDTVSFTAKAPYTYTVGSCPEGLYATREHLYVANSDNGAGQNASISIINLSTGAETQKKHTNIRNPQDVVALTNGAYYILDWGDCDEDGNQTDAGVYLGDDDNVTKRIENATMWQPITLSNGYYTSSYIYTVNAPKGSSTATYERYDLAGGSRTPFTTDGVACPTAIGVDPISGHVFVASCREDATGQPDYEANGYVRIYDPQSGRVLKEFECGACPRAFAFHLSYETITY